MKKLAVLLIVIPFLAAGAACKKNKKVERVGMVNFMAGTVTLIDGDTKAPAKVGDRVTMGMEIETGPASFVDIYFQENAIKVLEMTRVKVSDLTIDLNKGSEKTGFRVSRGRVFVRVAKKLARNDGFTVGTPTAIAAVRGTEFLVSEEGGRALVVCVEGEVLVDSEVNPEQEAVAVPGDREVVVEKDRKMSVKEISAENRRLIGEILGNFREMKRSLREEFEKQREEIRKAVEDQKQLNRDTIREQKDLDKKNIEDQKALDRANIDAIRGDTSGTVSEAGRDVEGQKADSTRNLEGVKPEIEKFDAKIE